MKKLLLLLFLLPLTLFGQKETIELEDNIIVYPNPVDETININKNVDITIYNILGDMIISKTNTNALDVSRLNPGIYNLGITCNNKLVNKIIIKK